MIAPAAHLVLHDLDMRRVRSTMAALVAAAALVTGCSTMKLNLPGAQGVTASSSVGATSAAPLRITPDVKETAAANVALLSRQPSRHSCPLGYPIQLVEAAGLADRFSRTPDRRSILGIGSGVIVCRMYSASDDNNGATFIAAPDKDAIDAYLGDLGKPVFGKATPMLSGSVRVASKAYVTKQGLGPGCDAMWTSSEVKLVIAVEDTWPGGNCLAEFTAAWGFIVHNLSLAK